MTFSKKLRPKPVTVEWRDSTTTGGWMHLDSIDPGALRVSDCISMGTIIHRDDAVVVVAGSVRIDEHGYIDHVCDVVTIPTACVVKVKRR